MLGGAAAAAVAVYRPDMNFARLRRSATRIMLADFDTKVRSDLHGHKRQQLRHH
jgi:branched-subunit amino acid aminotransferase/4-amino-4-deoxychorismate lyase